MVNEILDIDEANTSVSLYKFINISYNKAFFRHLSIVKWMLAKKVLIPPVCATSP